MSWRCTHFFPLDQTCIIHRLKFQTSIWMFPSIFNIEINRGAYLLSIHEWQWIAILRYMLKIHKYCFAFFFFTQLQHVNIYLLITIEIFIVSWTEKYQVSSSPWAKGNSRGKKSSHTFIVIEILIKCVKDCCRTEQKIFYSTEFNVQV